MRLIVFAFAFIAFILSFSHSAAFAETDVFELNPADGEKNISFRRGSLPAQKINSFNGSCGNCGGTFGNALSVSSLVPTADGLTAFQAVYHRDYASFDAVDVNADSDTIKAAGVFITGKILSPHGKMISDAVVYLSDASGNIRTGRTNSFGRYSFEGVAAGQFYTISATAKQFQFPAQLLTTSENLTEINLIAWE